MMGRLFQLSGVVVDLIYKVDAVPLPGNEAIVRDHTLTPGGGFNAMVAARRAGMEVVYAGTLGTGPFADMVEHALHDEGIDCLRPRLSDEDQGCCTVLVDPSGERSFIAASGADGVVRDTDLALVQPKTADWLLLSGYGLNHARSRGALTRWLATPRPGLQLVFDPCPIVRQVPAAARDTALAAASWVTANRDEGEALAGISDPEKAAVLLAAKRSGGALLRDGAKGCHLALPDGSVTFVPAYSVQSVDTNGAGDTHTGSFIARLAAGDPPLRALQIANISAALSTTQKGPATAPPIETVLDLLGHPVPAPGVA